MDAEQQARNAASFGAVAETYDRARPSYPAEAVRWLLPPDARDVVDLGAGTGKLTRELDALGLQVTAVDPSSEMLEQLHRRSPHLRTVVGSAERIPLPDACADAVLVAQAWHWVDPTTAVPEVARILRPEGRLGLVWNSRDERVGWVAELGALMDRAGGHNTPEASIADLDGPFGPLEKLEVTWTHPTTADGLVDLVASRSYVITATERDRNQLLDDVRGLIARHPELSSGTKFDLPYVTLCLRADKRL